MRKWLPGVGAAFGAAIGVLGNVLYQVGPDGESGALAGKGGIIFWWFSLPGQLASAPFEMFGIKHPWSSVLGGTAFWGVVGLFIAIGIGLRRAPSKDS